MYCSLLTVNVGMSDQDLDDVTISYAWTDEIPLIGSTFKGVDCHYHC